MSGVKIDMDAGAPKDVPDEEFLHKLIIENYDLFCREHSDGVVLEIRDDTGTLKKQLTVCAARGLGVYLNYSVITERLLRNIKGERKLVRMEDEVWLSLYDRKKLRKVVDIDAELYISEGLFLPKEQAWLGIRDFFRTGERCKEIKWIDADKMPEEGNRV